MNEYYYIILHKQFAYCNRRGTGHQREEEEDIGVLFSFNRLGNDEHYARNPGGASAQSLGQAQRWLALTLV